VSHCDGYCGPAGGRPGARLGPRRPLPGQPAGRQQRLAGVIDSGGLGAGDPAIDLLPAWAWLTAPARGLFRS
jgi:hypothetical protein